MGYTNILQIRALIKSAHKAEKTTQSLKIAVSEVLPALHSSIQLPPTNKDRVFIDFLTRYIDNVPGVLDTLSEIARDGNINELVQPVLSIVESHFLQKPHIADQDRGLRGLVCRAYLAHRIVEEFNEQIISSCGAPLINGDWAGNNLIVHAFIGDQFANKLDLAASFSVQALLPHAMLAEHASLKNYLQRHRLYGLNDALQLRASFTHDPVLDSKVSLRFSERTNAHSLH